MVLLYLSTANLFPHLNKIFMKRMVVPGIAKKKCLFTDVLLYKVSVQFVSTLKSSKYQMKKPFKKKEKAALELSQEVVITNNSAAHRPGECLPQVEESLTGQVSEIEHNLCCSYRAT